mgnify:CR=1 FL=1
MKKLSLMLAFSLLECFKYCGFLVLGDVWIFDIPQYDPDKEWKRRNKREKE